MNPKLRQMIGLVTIGLFGTVGVSLVMTDQPVAGVVILMFAALRAMVWVRQAISRAD